MSRNELVMRRVEPGAPVPGVPDRATRVASWIGWHLFEITGVSVPAVVAVSVTPWAWLVSGVVGAGWTANEVRVAQKQAAIKAGRDLSTVTASSDKDKSKESTEERTGETGVDGKRAGGAR